MHHWMYGLILLAIGIIIKNVPVYAIGIGLFVDELPYILIRGKTHKDNYSSKSLVGLSICILIVFIARKWLIFFL